MYSAVRAMQRETSPKIKNRMGKEEGVPAENVLKPARTTTWNNNASWGIKILFSGLGLGVNVVATMNERGSPKVGAEHAFATTMDDFWTLTEVLRPVDSATREALAAKPAGIPYILKAEKRRAIKAKSDARAKWQRTRVKAGGSFGVVPDKVPITALFGSSHGLYEVWSLVRLRILR